MRFQLAFAVLLSSHAFAAGPNPRFEKVLREVHANLNADHAMTVMRRVYASDRYFTFPRFQQTAEYLKQEMGTIGLHNVEIVEAPADGSTQVGFWTMPLAWDVRSAKLELLDNTLPP